MVPRDALTRRARYYRSQMDMDLLLTGHAYEELPDTYVIFICDFDPFGAGYFRYTLENRCLENMNRRLGDGCRLYFPKYLWQEPGGRTGSLGKISQICPGRIWSKASRTFRMTSSSSSRKAYRKSNKAAP